MGLSIILAGDVILERKLRRLAWPLQSVQSLFQKSDLSLVNLEAAITAQGWPLPKDISRTDPALVGDLKWLRVDGVALGNNHIMDFGVQGLTETLQHLNQNNIAYAGAGPDLAAAISPMQLTAQGVRVAVVSFLCWTHRPEMPDYSSQLRARPNRPGVATIDAYPVRLPGAEHVSTPLPLEEDLHTLESAVRAARQKADIVIASLHANWGDSLVVGPGQQMTAQCAIDAGADLVWGHGPHVLQGIQRYRGKLILHSLGNLIFEIQPERLAYFPQLQKDVAALRTYRPVWEAAIAWVEIEPQVLRLKLYPVQITASGLLAACPSLAGGRRGRAILERIAAMSAQLDTPIELSSDEWFLSAGTAQVSGSVGEFDSLEEAATQ